MSKPTATPENLKSARPVAAPAEFNWPRWQIAALLLLSAIFLRTLGNEFVNFDDDLYVTDNPRVQKGLTPASMKWAFYGTASANWHPVTLLSHMADCTLFGLRPWGHHLMSVLFHSANSVLLFLVLRRMTAAPWRSFAVAALFAVHPLHVESVAWVSERKDVLSGFFFLLTLWMYAAYVEQHRRLAVPWFKSLSYCVALGLFLLGLMSKPMLVTVPFVLLLLDYWPLRRLGQTVVEGEEGMSRPWKRWANLIWEKAPFFALTAVSCLVTYRVQRRAGAMWTFEEVPFVARVTTALVAYCRYLAKFFFPADLSVFYPHPGEWPVTTVVGALTLLGVLSLLALWWRRRSSYMIVGWLWFLGMLVPVIGLVQVGWQSLADRYMYLPMVGLLCALVWGAEALIANRSRWLVPASVAATGLVALSAALAWHQCGYWKSSETLFRHAMRVTRNNFVAHHNLGMALMGTGRLEEALQEFREALKLRPKSADSYNGIGEVLLRQGRLDEAMTLFHQALVFKPDLAIAHNNLGIALGRKGMTEQAISEFEQAIAVRPGYVKALNNLGLALQAGGRLDEAIERLQEAVQLGPTDSEAHKNLGMALGRKGRLEEAVAHLRRALELNPDDSQVCHNLGMALAKQGRWPEAIAQYERSLKLRSDSAETHTMLGVALTQTQRREEAIAHFKEALRINPNQAEALRQLRLVGERP